MDRHVRIDSGKKSIFEHRGLILVLLNKKVKEVREIKNSHEDPPSYHFGKFNIKVPGA